jgi:hydroxymethylpyrimidine pyrophosphatase-like HAD family hydrolase
MNISPVGMYSNSSNYNKNHSPAFGMAIIFKEPAIERIGKILTRTESSYKDTFFKQVKPLIKKSDENKIADVIVDTVPDDEFILKATVMEGNKSIAEYLQSDLLNYDFIKQGVDKAEYVKNLKTELSELSKK